jgi:LacI family transcriptional regulator
MSIPTLKSIAKATGFSITTVSRALGGFNDVNEVSRRLIIEEAIQQGYEPNLQARALQTRRTQTIGLILPVSGPDFHDPFFSELIAGIGNIISSSRFDLLLSSHNPVNGELEQYRKIVAGRRVDGLILIRTRYSDQRIQYLSQTQMPFVSFGRTSTIDKFVYVDLDGIVAQSMMTQHLIDLGHRRIAFITPPQELMFSLFRLQGFRETMQRNSIPIDELLIMGGDLTESGGSEMTEKLLQLTSPPSAIMCGNDLMALGAMDVIQRHGLRVGYDIAIGGFDDIPLAQYIHPSLTTIHQPIYQIGQQLARTLLKMITEDFSGIPPVLIQPELIIRRSSDPHFAG